MANNIGVTPNGTFTAPKHISWLNINDFVKYPTGLGITSSSDIYISGVLQSILDAACEWTEVYCNRFFVQQTIDEITPDIMVRQGHYIAVWLRNYPIQSINTVYLQSFKYFIPTDLSYMTLFQQEGYYELIPFLSSGVGNGADFIPTNYLNFGETNFWTNYTFGYDINSIPNPVYQASVYVAMKMIAEQQNPIGATDMKMGGTQFQFKLMQDQDDPLMKDIKQLLKPYKSIQFAST